jgi:hypothetical protein
MQSNQATREIIQEGIQSSPNAAFLRNILGALIFLTAVSGTAVFLLF